MLFQKTVLSPRAGEYFSRGLAAFGGMVFVVATIVARLAAPRRQRIPSGTLSAWSATWIAALLLERPALVPVHGRQCFAIGVLIAGIMALSVAPVVTSVPLHGTGRDDKGDAEFLAEPS